MRAGAWRSGDKPRLRQLSALSFGIVGFGLIGRTVAAKARGLFGRVLVHDPIAKPTDADIAAGYEFVDALSDLLARGRCPQRARAAHRRHARADRRRRARPHEAVGDVINVSRGGIVDEDALLDAVRAGRLAGAALDTFVKEPLPAEHPLMREPRILLSPHVAWLSEEAEIKLRQRASEELALILEGRAPASPVGPIRAVGARVRSPRKQGAAMIVDLRTYTLRPGGLAPYLDLYRREGYPVHTSHVGAAARLLRDRDRRAEPGRASLGL